MTTRYHKIMGEGKTQDLTPASRRLGWGGFFQRLKKKPLLSRQLEKVALFFIYRKEDFHA